MTTQWTSEAGPRQTKNVDKAIRAFRWRAKSHVEITDHGRSEVTCLSLAAGDDMPEDATTAENAIGEAHAWTITRANHKDIASAYDAARVALVLPEVDNRTTQAERDERAERMKASEAAREEGAKQLEASKAAIEAKRPAWAKALIVAQLDENTSDLMTDYHAHTTTRYVAIGWRKSSREDFKALRKAAATFPETAHLGPGCDIWTVEANRDPARDMQDPNNWQRGKMMEGDHGTRQFTTKEEAEAAISEMLETDSQCRDDHVGCCDFPYYAARFGVEYHKESVEHRNNWSMGAGNFVKAGHDDSSGWCVKSEPIGGGYSAYEDHLPELGAKPQATTTGQPVEGVEVQQHHHTKKGFVFFLVVQSERVERDVFDAQRAQCKAAGGWYSRKWGTTPGGFAFKEEADANAFAASLSGNDGPHPERQAADNTAMASNRARHSAGKPAKLRETSAKWLEDCEEQLNRDRQENTPKRLGQARSAQRDARQGIRAARLMAIYADHLEAGTLPAELDGFKPNKGNFFSAEGLESVPVSNGYHGYSVDGKEYRNQDAYAVALRSLAESAKTDEDREAELKAARDAEINAAIDEVRNSTIEGFFPTPDDVIARMIDEADIDAGQLVLEPSAGIGSIADAIEDAGGEVHCVELRPSLIEILRMKGFSTVSGDFVETMEAAEMYDRILMNPPFEKGQAAKHINHAFKLLKPGGRLVALLPPNQVELLDLGDDCDINETDLGAAFNTAGAFRKTGVSVCSVIVDKHEAPEPVTFDDYDSDEYDVEGMAIDYRNNNLDPDDFDAERYRVDNIVQESFANGQFTQARQQCESYGMNYEAELVKFQRPLTDDVDAFAFI